MSRTFYLTVGIPGSGKSTIVARLQQETGATVVSTDAIRLELTGNAEDQSKNTHIFTRVVPDRITAGLSSGDVIFDATNVSRKARKDPCALARGLGARVVALVMDTPFEECYKRNKLRSRVVPDFVLDKMVEAWQDPDVNIEKIDEVRKVTS